MLKIKNHDKIKIYKVKYFCIYFKYENQRYMIRHISDCGYRWNELTDKNTWETICSDYTLFDIKDFIKPKYGKYKDNMPYSHLDLEYFVECLNKQFRL